MLTPLYFIVCNDNQHGDRIKNSFLSHVLTQIILQSLPMGIYQGIYSFSYEEHRDSSIKYISPIISMVMVAYGVFILNLIIKMNAGGLNWIQKPKSKLQFYSPSPIPLNNFKE